MSGKRYGKRIATLLQEGLSYADIQAKLGCTKSAVSYQAKKLGLGQGPRQSFDWAAVQRFHDAGHSRKECQLKFGFSHNAWYDARDRGDLKPADARIPLSTLLVVGRRTGRAHLKARLLEAELLRPECYECGISTWQGRPLTLHLDHINGVNDDNRLKNLRLLCPNCHSQTGTYGGRNVGVNPTATGE